MPRRLVPAAALAASVAVASFAVTPASAVAYDFAGGCAFVGAQQWRTGTPTWEGVIGIAMAATADGLPAPGVPLTAVRCEVRRNGESALGRTFPGADGTGSTASVGRFELWSLPGDVITVCAAATVGATPRTHCHAAEMNEVPPQPAVGAAAFGLDTARTAAVDPVNAFVCQYFRGLAPTTNELPVPVRSDPVTGDTYVNGVLIVDCAPYAFPDTNGIEQEQANVLTGGVLYPL